jgi:osmotically-inducible protein OsmY
MNRKYAIALIVTAGFLGVVATGPPTFFAADQAAPDTAKQGEQNQSAIKDAWLPGKLGSAPLFNEHLNSFDIDTGVRNGVASLRGAVESDIDRDLAREIAKSIVGVTKVENSLVVDKAKAAMSKGNDAAKERQGFEQKCHECDGRCTNQVTAADEWQHRRHGIDVDSKQGAVTLSGIVRSKEEKDLAIKLASNTSGAVSVADHLVVEPDQAAGALTCR